MKKKICETKEHGQGNTNKEALKDAKLEAETETTVQARAITTSKAEQASSKTPQPKDERNQKFCFYSSSLFPVTWRMVRLPRRKWSNVIHTAKKRSSSTYFIPNANESFVSRFNER